MAQKPAWQKDFANIKLTEADRDSLQAYRDSHDDNAFAPIEELLLLGYKLSIVWSDPNSAFILSVIGTENTKRNKNLVMSSFSDDLAEAMFMCGYKVLELTQGGEWPLADSSSRWG